MRFLILCFEWWDWHRTKAVPVKSDCRARLKTLGVE